MSMFGDSVVDEHRDYQFDTWGTIVYGMKNENIGS